MQKETSAGLFAGNAMVWLVTPLGPSNLHRLHHGDVVAVPEGFVLGIHNDGKNKFRALGVAPRHATPRQATLRCGT